MSSLRQGTEFCRLYYYLAMASSRIHSMLKMKLCMVHEQKQCTKSNFCLWLNDVKIFSRNMKTSNQQCTYATKHFDF